MRTPNAAASLLVLVLSLLGACRVDERLEQLLPGLTLAPASVSFATTPVGLARDAVITARDPGGAPVVGLDARIDGAAAFTVDPVPDEIAPRGSVALSVHYAPRAAADDVATLTFRAGALSASVALAGSGFAAPSCDDGNPCTRETLQLDGSCTRAVLAGACDDGDACTDADVCVGDRCVGAALDCTPPASCFLGLCDTEDGCVFIPAEGACDDGDPCTVDACTNAGCTHETAGDGAPCGSFEQCATLHVCVAGACLEAAIPDGAPCSDHDACTEQDACAAGTCGGAPVVAPAALVGFAPTFASEGALGTVLDDGRLLVVDPLPTASGTATGALVTVLARDGQGGGVSASADLGVVGEELRTDLDVDFGRAGVFPLGPGRAAIVAMNGDIVLLSVTDDGHVAVRGRALGALPFAGQQPSALARRGDVVYGCAIGAESVTAVDIADVDAPLVTAVVPLPGPCTAVAVDPVRARLLVSSSVRFDYSNSSGTGGGFTIFSLANPRVPLAARRALAGVGALVATNGVVVAVADPGPFSGTSVVTLLDAADLSMRGGFDSSGGMLYVDASGDLAFSGNRLFVQSKARLSVWDVLDPAHPQLEFALEHSGVGDASNFPPRDVLSTDGATLFRAGDGVFGGDPLILDVTGATAHALQHRARGGIQRLVARGGTVYALDRVSVHRVDGSDASNPTFASGSVVAANASASTLWTLGASTDPIRAFASRSWPSVFTSAYATVWRDGTIPSSPLALSVPFVPFTHGVVHVVDDGHRALGLEYAFSDDAATLSSWNLAALPAVAVDGGFPPAGTLPLLLDDGTVDHNGAVALALHGDRAVSVTHDPIVRFDDAVLGPRAHVTLVEVADDGALTPLANAIVRGPVLSAGVLGDRVVLVVTRNADGDPCCCCGEFRGELVQSYARSGGDLVLEGIVSVPQSAVVLDVGPATALVSTATGVTFVALESTGPRVVGDVALPEPPSSALAVQDRVWLAGPHGVAAVKPPCE